MSKRKNATPEQVHAWIARGDGQGEFESYKPFFHVRDVPSQGRSAIDLGIKTNRKQYYLSDIEYSFHVMSEYSINVTDIREQYACLPWEETQQIARELGIRHPIYPGTTTPIVITTDIVLTMQNSNFDIVPVSIKPSSEIDPKNPKAKRTLEKLLIEKVYWQRRSKPWINCTEKMIPKHRAYNLDFFRITMQSREMDYLNLLLSKFVNTFIAIWQPNLTLHQLLCDLSDDMKITKDEVFTLIGRAIWMRMLPIDLDREAFDHELPLILKNSCASGRGE